MKETKGIIRVPTKTPYAFIEMHVEGSAQDFVDSYNELNKAYWGQGEKEIPRREWNDLFDAYRQGVPIQTKDFERMSKLQIDLIHELDKSDNRMNHDKFPFHRESQRPETDGGNEVTGSEETRV